MKTIWEWLTKTAFVVGAVICFVLSVWLALEDKVPAATLLAGMFIVLTLFHFLPQLESFKAYGVEAKWREKISEADKVLSSLRSTLAMFGKMTYYTFGSGSRVSHPVGEKQRLADELDALLRANDVPEADILAMKEKYIFYCVYDINSVLQRIKERLAIAQAAKFTSDAVTFNTTDPSQAEPTKEKGKRVLRYNQQTREAFPTDNFLKWCLESLPPSELLEPADEKVLRAFAERCGKAGEACVKEGRLTDEGVAIIRSAQLGTDVLFERLFGRKP
jgi:hypothetical protein